MKKSYRWLVVLLLLALMVQPGYGSVEESKEVTGRGEQAPVAILADQEGFIVLFQEPGRMVRYDNEWNELIVVNLPEEFSAGDLIAAGKFIWTLDERQGIVLQLDPSSLKIMDSFESKYPYELSGIFEMDECVFVMDDTGCIRQVDEEFTLLGWLSGARAYQAVTYDGYFIYVAGKLQSAGSGVLVKTLENEKEAEWLMSDDPDTMTYVDTVKQIRLLPDGYFYVVYRDSGIAKYDADGVYQSTVYPELDMEREFSDVAYHPVSKKVYLVDRMSGVFEVTWPEAKELKAELVEISWNDYDWSNMSIDEFLALWDQWVPVVEEDLGPSHMHMTMRTYRGVTKAQIGLGKLVYYYQSKKSVIRIPMPLRKADSMELKIPTADLLVAKECGIEWMEILWKNVQYRFPIVEWTLELVTEPEEPPLDFDDEFVDGDGEDMDFDNFFEDEGVEEETLEEEHVGIAEEYIEIRISQEKIAIDVCVVEWLNEISKLVRRERLK
ncbi:hypothetical protein SANA_27470 [Gottschalkiaceae bacterium SANA]|nr:hypothetical protein SANA_27470 [Gottschalkiaceae bacterium SANA]